MNVNTGSDEFGKIKDGLRYLTGESDVSLETLMTDEFVAENTDFDTWRSLLNSSGVAGEKDFDGLDFDGFIKKNTRFDGWEDMLGQAASKYASGRLG